MSVLEAQPSARDSRFYLKAFAPPAAPPSKDDSTAVSRNSETQQSSVTSVPSESTSSASSLLPAELKDQISLPSAQTTVAESILNPILQHTGLVKIQGPFSDRQLQSVCNGMVYLRRLGLVAIIVADLEGWSPKEENARAKITEQVMRVTEALEEQGGAARPILDPILRKGPTSGRFVLDNLSSLRSAIQRGEIPVLPPFILEGENKSTCVSPNEMMPGLAAALAEESSSTSNSTEDLTPVRIMVINREGGIPSHARGGTPHLSINLESEYDFIHATYEWRDTHPTALSNLKLIRDCLSVLPRTASAVVNSHRSPRALIANLVTNRPAHSPSLHVSALPSHVKLEHTPTIIRLGLPIKVHRSLDDINLPALTRLLESSFGKTLNQEAYYDRLRKHLDFLIVAGDCAAVAIVTKEGRHGEVSYLDKFAVLPSLQGDGTVDFMWGALRDESFGLGLLDALNNNGGLEGRGNGVDLVWRSRADNPVNKWYFERSNGFVKLDEMGKGGTPGMLFWCDAEERLEKYQKSSEGKVPYISKDESGRLGHWNEVVGAIKSCWK